MLTLAGLAQVLILRKCEFQGICIADLLGGAAPGRQAGAARLPRFEATRAPHPIQPEIMSPSVALSVNSTPLLPGFSRFSATTPDSQARLQGLWFSPLAAKTRRASRVGASPPPFLPRDASVARFFPCSPSRPTHVFCALGAAGPGLRALSWLAPAWALVFRWTKSLSSTLCSRTTASIPKRPGR